MCPAQGKRSIVFGAQAVDLRSSFASWPLTIDARPAAAGPTRQASAIVEIRERRREPPVRSDGTKAAQPRERQLGLHAALGPHELVPFVDDDRRRAWAKRSRQSARASRSVRLSGVVTSAVGNFLPWRARAAAPVSPVRTSIVQWGARSAAARQREAGVAGERAERRDPDERERRRQRPRAGRARSRAAAGRGVRLAHAGRGVDEPRRAAGVGPPHLVLEREGRPALGGEPGAGSRRRLVSPGADARRWVHSRRPYGGMRARRRSRAPAERPVRERHPGKWDLARLVRQGKAISREAVDNTMFGFRRLCRRPERIRWSMSRPWTNFGGSCRVSTPFAAQKEVSEALADLGARKDLSVELPARAARPRPAVPARCATRCSSIT